MGFMHYARYDEQGRIMEEIFLCDSCNEEDDIELDGEDWVCLGVTCDVEACSECGEDGM